MSHRLVFQVEVELEREEGKFASRDEMAEAIIEWLESANEQSVDGIGADGESTYEVTVWEVAVVDEQKRGRRR
jgi:hypothetical protein